MTRNRLLARLASYDHRISTVLLILVVIAGYFTLPQFWAVQVLIPVASVVALVLAFVFIVRLYHRGQPRKRPRGSWGF
jgi:hypothetical protein